MSRPQKQPRLQKPKVTAATEATLVDRDTPTPFDLYSSPSNHLAHRIRFVVAEKEIECNVKELAPVQMVKAMAKVRDHNPWGRLPHLHDKDNKGMHIFDSLVAIEYIDERYPQPTLMPNVPVERARIRMLMSRFNTEWNDSLTVLEQQPKSRVARQRAKEKIREDIVGLASLLNNQKREPVSGRITRNDFGGLHIRNCAVEAAFFQDCSSRQFEF